MACRLFVVADGPGARYLLIAATNHPASHENLLDEASPQGMLSEGLPGKLARGNYTPSELKCGVCGGKWRELFGDLAFDEPHA
jgi:hypothetical protein